MNDLFGANIRKQLFPKKRKKICHSNGGILGNLHSNKTVKEEKLSTKAPLRRKRQNLSVLANISCNVPEKGISALVGVSSMLTFNGSSMVEPGVLGGIGVTGATKTKVTREETKGANIKGKKYLQTSVLETLNSGITTNVVDKRSSRRKRKGTENNKKVISVPSNQRAKKNKDCVPSRCLENKTLGSKVLEKKLREKQQVKPTGDDGSRDSCLVNKSSINKEPRSSADMQGSEEQSQYSASIEDNTPQTSQQNSLKDEMVLDCSPGTLFSDTDIDLTVKNVANCSDQTENKPISSEIIKSNMLQESLYDEAPFDSHDIDLVNTAIIKDSDQYETHQPASGIQHTYLKIESYKRQCKQHEKSRVTPANKKLEPDGEKAMSKHLYIQLIDTDAGCKPENKPQTEDSTLKKRDDIQSSPAKELSIEKKIEPPGSQVNGMSFTFGSPESRISVVSSLGMTQSSSKQQKKYECLNLSSILDLIECKNTVENNSTRGFEIAGSADQQRRSKCLNTNIAAIQQCLSAEKSSCKRNCKQSEEASSLPELRQEKPLSRECNWETKFLHSVKDDVPKTNSKAMQDFYPAEERIARPCPVPITTMVDAPGSHVLEIDYLVPLTVSNISGPNDISSPKDLPLSFLELPPVKDALSPFPAQKSPTLSTASFNVDKKVRNRLENKNLVRIRKSGKTKNERKSKKVRTKKHQTRPSLSATLGNKRKSLRERIKTDRYSPCNKGGKSRDNRLSNKSEIGASTSLDVGQELSTEDSIVSEKICLGAKSNSLVELRKDDVTEPEIKGTTNTSGSQRKSLRQRIKTDRYSPCTKSGKSRGDRLSHKSEVGASTSLDIEQELSTEKSVISEKVFSRSESHERLDLKTEDLSSFDKKQTSPRPAASNDTNVKNAPDDRGEDERAFGQNPESRIWTDVQLAALRKAYNSVDPRSDQFWFEISRNVDGKNEEECGDKWFDLVETPARENKKKKARKTNSKRQTQKKVTDVDEDDIFNATPMKLHEGQGSYGNSSALFNVDLSPIIDEGQPRKNFATEYDDTVESGPLVSRAGYKSYVQNLRRDISRAKKVKKKRKRSISRTKSYVLSDKVGYGDLEVDGCLTPGGTLRVRTVDCNQEEDDFFGSDNEEE